MSLVGPCKEQAEASSWEMEAALEAWPPFEGIVVHIPLLGSCQ